MEELTNQQKAFAHEYFMQRKKNQTKAAIAAGYSEKSAASQSSRLLSYEKVQNYIRKKEQEMIEGLKEEFIHDAVKAREVMYEIMVKPKARDRDKLNAAKDFLDRAGFKPTEEQILQHKGKIDVNNPLEGLTTDEIKQLLSIKPSKED